MQTAVRLWIAAIGMLAVLCGSGMMAEAQQKRSSRQAPARREFVLRPLYPDAAPTRSYESLASVSIPNTTIDSVTLDPDDGACRVTATVTHPPAGDRVRVWIGLPLKGWNGRFWGTGGGGFSGGSPRALAEVIAKGFAAGATDTGHEGDSGSFALDSNGRLDWHAIRNNAYRGIHDMTVVGKALTEAFYGKPPRYSYFVGGSTGGRQALSEAQRYPEDYDGVIAIAPAINWAKFVAGEMWPQVVMLEARNFVSEAKLHAVTAAAVAACDALDGVTDGVLNDPFRCTYDPGALVGTMVEGSRFTEADAKVVRKIWEGPRGANGEFLWHGMPLGTDLISLAGTEGSPLTGRPFHVSHDWYRYFLKQDPKWDWATLTRGEFEQLFQQSVEQYSAVISTDNPDLSRFRDRGGKLLLLHGLIDQLIVPQGTIDYYERVVRQMGGAAKTARFARLFLAPGVGHGWGDTGPAPQGATEAIMRWVEEGKAPSMLRAELRDPNGAVIRSRPLFPYPRTAKYRGHGSTDDAASFVSSLPEPLPPAPK